MPKNENYITVFGWMVNDLKLKGNELLVYALIYGFSQDDESEFQGSINYIKGWLGASSRTTVINTLSSLTDKGLITKHEIIVNGVKFCRYKASTKNVPVVQKMYWGSTKNVPGGSTKNVPNNTNTNNSIKNNSTYRSPPKKVNFDGRQYDFNKLEEQLIGY